MNDGLLKNNGLLAPSDYIVPVTKNSNGNAYDLSSILKIKFEWKLSPNNSKN